MKINKFTVMYSVLIYFSYTYKHFMAYTYILYYIMLLQIRKNCTIIPTTKTLPDPSNIMGGHKKYNLPINYIYDISTYIVYINLGLNFK